MSERAARGEWRQVLRAIVLALVIPPAIGVWGAAAAGGGTGAVAFAQWKTYTMKSNVRDLTMGRDSTLWAATSGGLFSFHFPDSSYQEYTSSEGLRSVDLSAVAMEQDKVWIGASNGFLHRYDPASRTWDYVPNIAERREPQKRINALHVEGDTLVILSDLGTSFFSISRMEFSATYMQYGTAPSVISGGVTDFQIFSGKMWISTRSGIASTPLANPNPAAPESWQVYARLQGLPSISVTGLSVLDSTLYASTSAGLAFFDPISGAWGTVPATAGLNVLNVSDELSPKQSGCAGTHVLEFVTRSDAGQVTQRTELWSYARAEGEGGGAGLAARLSSAFPSFLSTISPGGILGSQGSGAIVYNICPSQGDSAAAGIVSVLAPAGPPSSKFIGLAVDNRGVVWSATGAANGEGFMSFDGSRWSRYSVSSEPRLLSDAFYKVSIGAGNAKWVSNFGSGIALLDDGGNFKKMLNWTNGLPPSLGDAFVVVGGVATDPGGATWITDRTPPGDTSLVVFNPDSSFSYVVGCGPGCGTRRPAAIFTDVAIDPYGTKWFSNFNRFEPPVVPDRYLGFLFYNGRVAIPGASSDGWGKLTTDDGLTSVQVWSVAVDRDGAVWVGTDQGISIIFDPTNPRRGIAAYHPLRDQLIQAIVVDPLNNKWIATRQGVFLLSPDGTVILNRYTVTNTDGKLLDDDIASIAMDNRTGTLYFGTEKGLTSLATPGSEPKASFDELSFAPNPFPIPTSAGVTVDGLVAGSTLKILSIDGNLVREIQTPGGRVGFWDGRDGRGQFVSTGVYIVVAYSEDGSKITKGKLAVIRQ